jgi:L-ribulose-5-phosphate 3-epimerase
MTHSRRHFLASTGAAAVFACAGTSRANAFAKQGMSCAFRLSVINDEITQDFGRACEIASGVMGLGWIELRGMWNKNIADLDSAEVAEARRILEKNHLRVTDIASPLFKVNWLESNAPKDSQQPGSRNADRGAFHNEYAFKQQDQLLERCIELAKAFQTDRIRCFDFLRLDNQAPYREAINDKLREAAVLCAKSNQILLLENEESCNTRTSAEAAAVLKAIPNKNFMLNWDPANAASVGDTPYPNGYAMLPKDRIGHCHCKDVVRDKEGKYHWAPVGAGIIDWVGQFRSLKRDGFHYAVSLETHWHGAGTPEESTRKSMQGLRTSLKQAGIDC